jgi:hypothetical protein
MLHEGCNLQINGKEKNRTITTHTHTHKLLFVDSQNGQFVLQKHTHD